MKLDPTSDHIAKHLSSAYTNRIVQVAPYDTYQFDQFITRFYQSRYDNQIDAIADLFLNLPYKFEPVGEGPLANFSQEPLYRTDEFDCVSFVNTILALFKSTSLNEFKKNILQLRYGELDINFCNRTDWFTDLEWLPNLRRLAWLQDGTYGFFNQQGSQIIELAETEIDKKSWYQCRPFSSLHLLPPFPNDFESQQLLKDLREKGKPFSPQKSSLNYLPLTALFDENGCVIEDLLEQLVTPSVILIVRPNWNIKDSYAGYSKGYGSNLNVSHLGLGVRDKNKDLYFYHASSTAQKVQKERLVDYLQKFLHHDSIKGIHVEKIV